ncbi:MAG TPA: DNA-binding protein [Ruminococcaceae bacterium]|nr:DNA-binding protein [Oscillospiraceae bacterium]HCM24570.1 DNA-binding protein [Oscillospiraceae bacterium]
MAKNLEISLLLDYYSSMLTKKQREVISCYYNDDLSLSEIAQNEGITRQGVRDSIKRGEAQLIEMEKNLGILRKSRQRAAAYAQIRQYAEHIRDYNSRFVYDKSITEQIEKLLKILAKLEDSE